MLLSAFVLHVTTTLNRLNSKSRQIKRKCFKRTWWPCSPMSTKPGKIFDIHLSTLFCPAVLCEDSVKRAGMVSLTSSRQRQCFSGDLAWLTPRIYVFWGAIQYFAGQRYTLTKLQNACNFYIIFAASLIDSQKDTKLRAHTVNLAFKLRSFVG